VAPSVTGVPAPVLDAPSQALADAIDAAKQAGDVEPLNRLQAQLWLDGPAQREGRVGGEARALFLDMNRIALQSPPVGDLVDAPPAWPRLEALPLPVRLVWGSLDLPHLVARCREMARRLPGARCWPLPGVAHLPSLEAPQAFNRVLREAGLLQA
jgi:pimeloyl-ACP methyl ester carboxylesterase